jgi:diguanylate cyclase (GGDEF)-like protein
LIRALDPSRPNPRLLVGEVDAAYLWGLAEAGLHRADLCVFDHEYRALACSQTAQFPNLPGLLGKKAQAAHGDTQWKIGSEKFVGYFNEFYPAGERSGSRWIVVAAQRKTDALEALNGLNMLSLGSIAVFALMAGLLSTTQIRRTLAPLKELIDGTTRLRNKEFSTRVDIDSDDEFGDLAKSFNAMAGRLGRQFDVMTTLSAIDKAILFDLEIERVMEEVLISLRQIFNLRCAGIAVTDRESPEEMQLYTIGHDPNRPMVKRRHIGADSRSILLASADESWISGENSASALMSQQHGWDAQHTFNFPIASKSGIGGLMLLGFAERIEFEVEDIENIRDFADRIGVALTSAARDEQLFRQARYDSLTGLPNRFLLVERLKQEIAQATRSDKKFAVLYIDLDRFKQVNDSFGHAAGDRLLQEAAHRLRECVRESDTVARVGGDEFTIILSGFGDAQVAGIVADHVLTEMDKPFSIAGTEQYVTASIGVVVYPQDGASPNELLNNADTAMYRSKASGRSTCVFFEENMNAEAVRIATLDRDLRHALADKQLMLHYQPQIELSTGNICAVEALVRWQHPERGLLSPATFVDFAEDSGLIVAVGEFVLKEACRQFCAWRDAGINVGRVSVNVSGKQFRQLEFVKLVEQIIVDTGIPANRLAMEITENVLLHDMDQVSEVLTLLRAHGIRIELDDFGTGYSSMSYLEKLPVNALKIDRTFVRTIDSAGRGGVIAKLVLDMARSLNMSVIAEGIQQPEQLAFMRANRCDIGQGFLFSRPLPADEISTFYANWNLVTRNTLFPRTSTLDQAVES